MIIKIFPDREKVKSMLNLIKDREEFISTASIKFPKIIAENYYEIMKELITALLLLDGKKAIGENSHKEMIEQLFYYRQFRGLNDIYSKLSY